MQPSSKPHTSHPATRAEPQSPQPPPPAPAPAPRIPQRHPPISRPYKIEQCTHAVRPHIATSPPPSPSSIPGYHHHGDDPHQHQRNALTSWDPTSPGILMQRRPSFCTRASVSVASFSSWGRYTMAKSAPSRAKWIAWGCGRGGKEQWCSSLQVDKSN